MRFWDSSAVIPLFAAERGTARMRELASDGRSIAVWWGTEVECVSALSRKERSGSLDAAGVAGALDQLDLVAERWHEIHPTDTLRRTARRLVRVHDVRAADALQLAAAIVASEGQTGSLEFLTLDDRLADAARREGFPVIA